MSSDLWERLIPLIVSFISSNGQSITNTEPADNSSTVLVRADRSGCFITSGLEQLVRMNCLKLLQGHKSMTASDDIIDNIDRPN